MYRCSFWSFLSVIRSCFKTRNVMNSLEKRNKLLLSLLLDQMYFYKSSLTFYRKLNTRCSCSFFTQHLELCLDRSWVSLRLVMLCQIPSSASPQTLLPHTFSVCASTFQGAVPSNVSVQFLNFLKFLESPPQISSSGQLLSHFNGFFYSISFRSLWPQSNFRENN